MFYDQVRLKLVAGKGGNGIVSFKRSKNEPRGGPDGGDGGDGGDVYLKATKRKADLVDYINKRKLEAEDGKDGEKNERTGPSGDNLVLEVPVGTVVYRMPDKMKLDKKELDENSLKKIVDLTKDGQEVLIAQGGRGGKGNAQFKTSTNQAPRKATDGKPGESEKIFLKLKLLADIGFIGQPNAGKSTLLSTVTRAKPEIASYPFTTTTPNLGVLNHKGEKRVLADIPGLIENAHKGKGLGDQFLQHIERCQVLVHLISIEKEDPLSTYEMIREELEKYHSSLLDKEELVVLNKIDLIDEKELAKKVDKLEDQLDKQVFPISASSKKGLEPLLDKIIELS